MGAHDVSLQIESVRKLPATQGTAVRLHAGMCQHVTLQAADLRKLAIADGTGIRTRTGMRPDVDGETGQVRKPHAALVTTVRLFPRVAAAHVLLQTAGQLIRAAADTTSVTMRGAIAQRFTLVAFRSATGRRIPFANRPLFPSINE